MPRPLSIRQAAHEFTASPAPVLLLDTCSVLDVIRAPFRRGNHCIEPARRLAEMAEQAPPALHVVAGPVIPDELAKHAPAVADELARHIRNTDASLTALCSACDLAGIAVAGPHVEYDRLGLPDRLREIALRLYDAAVVLEADKACRSRTANRSIFNRPPSRKGKGTKDCDLVEHYLALCRELGAGTFEEKVVLVSSNTEDFCERSATMHAELLDEFSCVDFNYTANLAWAQTELGL